MEGKECGAYELVKEGEDRILRIDYEGCTFSPSLEDNSLCMSKTIDVLMEVGVVTKILFTQKRDYEYDYFQTQLLMEIAGLLKRFSREKDIFGYKPLSSDTVTISYYNSLYAEVSRFVFNLAKSDPLGAYVELDRLLRRERIRTQHVSDKRLLPSQQQVISLLEYILGEFDKLRIVLVAKPYLPGYKLGDRDIYRRVFTPTMKPDFMYTKLMAAYPVDGEELDTYQVGETEITMFGFPDSARNLYHMLPPEFKLTEEKYEMVDLARKIMAEHKPSRQEFVDPERMREVFFSIGRDLIEELATYRGYKFRSKEMDELAKILVRYTVGFGLIEVLLSDDKIQDVSINSPMGKIPMFVVHQDYGDCYTNIIQT
jgi:hypothetical protein